MAAWLAASPELYVQSRTIVFVDLMRLCGTGRITDTIMAQVRSEMKAPADMKIDIPGREEGGSVELLSKTPPLEMSDYLDSVYQRNAAYAAALSSKSSPSKGTSALRLASMQPGC